MPTFVKLGEPLKSSFLFEEPDVGLVHHDLSGPWIDGTQDHFAHAFFDLVPKKVEVEDMLNKVVDRNRWGRAVSTSVRQPVSEFTEAPPRARSGKGPGRREAVAVCL